VPPMALLASPPISEDDKMQKTRITFYTIMATLSGPAKMGPLFYMKFDTTLRERSADASPKKARDK